MLKDPLASNRHATQAVGILSTSLILLLILSFPLLSNTNFHITLHCPRPTCSIDQVTSNKKKQLIYKNISLVGTGGGRVGVGENPVEFSSNSIES